MLLKKEKIIKVMSNREPIILTDTERKVLRKLHDRVKSITRGKTPDKRLVSGIINSCSSWNFPVIFEDDSPEEIARACRGLLEKKLVEQFDDKGCPSFIPVSETTIVEYSYRKFTQADA